MSLSPPALFAEQKRIAVLEFTNEAGLSSFEVETLADDVRAAALVLSPEYTVMTRESMMAMLPPGTDLSKCSEAQCEVDAGRRVGADLVVAGTVGRYAGDLVVRLKLFDTASAALLKQQTAEGASSKLLRGALKNAARGLVTSVRPGGVGATTGETPNTAFGGGTVIHGVAALDKGATIVNENSDDTGFLLITSTPSGATLYLNGKEIGTTPKQLDQMVGRYVVTAELGKYYHPARQDVTLTTAGAEVALTLTPAFGGLKVTSEPSGANLWLDGQRMGVTPYEDERKASGTYELRVVNEYHHSYVGEVTVDDGKITTEHLALKKNCGTLEVTSDPPGAELWLDGESIGVTPYEDTRKPSGNYDLRVVHQHHLSHRGTVTVSDGQTTSERVTLEANYGALEVSSEPPGAAITLNGESTDRTTPTSFDKLEPGSYTVGLSLSGYGDWVERAPVEKLGRTKLAPVLQAKLGLLSLMSVYEDGEMCRGEVYVDGKSKGRTPLKVELTATSHDVEVRCPKGKSRATVRLKHNETVKKEWVIPSRLSPPGAWEMMRHAIADASKGWHDVSWPTWTVSIDGLLLQPRYDYYRFQFDDHQLVLKTLPAVVVGTGAVEGWSDYVGFSGGFTLFFDVCLWELTGEAPIDASGMHLQGNIGLLLRPWPTGAASRLNAYTNIRGFVFGDFNSEEGEVPEQGASIPDKHIFGGAEWITGLRVYPFSWLSLALEYQRVFGEYDVEKTNGAKAGEDIDVEAIGGRGALTLPVSRNWSLKLCGWFFEGLAENDTGNFDDGYQNWGTSMSVVWSWGRNWEGW